MHALSSTHVRPLVRRAAIMAAAVAGGSRQLWWVDPAGAAFISAFVIWSWAEMATEQVRLFAPFALALFLLFCSHEHLSHGY